MNLEYNIRKGLGEKSPALVMLHGYGSNKEDLFSFVGEIPEKYTVISLQAPYSMGADAYAWFAISITEKSFWFEQNQAKSSLMEVLDFVKNAIEMFDLDPQRICLVGFSQGTMLSLALTLSYPEIFKRMVGFSGRLMPEVLTEGFEKKDFSKTKIYISHGTQDQVIPVEDSRQMTNFLDSLSIDYKREEFISAHNISLKNFNSFIEWISANV